MAKNQSLNYKESLSKVSADAILFRMLTESSHLNTVSECDKLSGIFDAAMKLSTGLQLETISQIQSRTSISSLC